MHASNASPGGFGLTGGEMAAKLTSLADCNYRQLQAEWRRLYRSPPPKQISRDLLRLGIAWKLQERAQGGLGRTVLRKLAKVAELLDEGGDVALPREKSLKTGTRLVREWNGDTHDVLVIDGGFRWRGRTWASLSAIAREITGTRWSGPRFFGVTSNRNRGAVAAASRANRTEEVGHDATR